MFSNWLAAALRNLLRNRLTSFVAVVGLAIGCATAILIALYIRAETTYESFIPGHERTYHVSVLVAESQWRFDSVDQRVAEWLANDYPEIEAIGRLAPIEVMVKRGALTYPEQAFAADAQLLQAVPLPSFMGDASAALERPDAVVLTRSAARRYFGRDAALGELLDIELARRYTSIEEARAAKGPEGYRLQVLAVLEDLPPNTHFRFDMLVSARAPFSPLLALPTWLQPKSIGYTAHTYYRLAEGESGARLERDASTLIERHIHGGSVDNDQIAAELRPIRSMHLSPPARDSMKPRGSRQTLYAVASVAVLILVIAASNFVNLLTGRATQRAVEVGVRKVVGASRRDLFVQFLMESAVYVVLAMVLALAIAEIILPQVRAFADELGFGVMQIVSFEYWSDPALGAAILALIAILTIAAGAYPALVLSGFRPIQVLRAGSLPTSAPARVRYVMVVLQFAALIALMYCSTVVYRQLDFALSERLRLNTDHVLILETADDLTHWEGFQARLRKIPGVLELTSSMTAPTNRVTGPVTLAVPSKGSFELPMSLIAHDFMKFYDVPLLAGRYLSQDLASDGLILGEQTAVPESLSVLINESAARTLGFTDPQQALEQAFELQGWGIGGIPQPRRLKIAGVVADFPVDSVRVPIAPTVYAAIPVASLVSVRTDGERTPEVLAAIDELWSSHSDRVINRWFLSEYYQRLYIDVIQQRRLLGAATAVAALVAALGMFTLSISMTQQRIKEVGIRKAMGAGTRDVMKLLLWTFARPVLWAQLIAWPAGALLMRRWLEDFQYRVGLGLWWLPLCSLLAIAIAMVTVSAYCYLASKTKPVAALRYE